MSKRKINVNNSNLSLHIFSHDSGHLWLHAYDDDDKRIGTFSWYIQGHDRLLQAYETLRAWARHSQWTRTLSTFKWFGLIWEYF
jgi:hypothetical protein